jgi:hypothetical protein
MTSTHRGAALCDWYARPGADFRHSGSGGGGGASAEEGVEVGPAGVDLRHRGPNGGAEAVELS